MIDYEKNSVLIWGAGVMGKDVYKALREDIPEARVVAFVDNLDSLWGKEEMGIPVVSPQEMLKISFERIYLATTTGFFEVREQLKALGIPSYKIDLRYPMVTVTARINFVRDFSKLVHESDMFGNVAEAGVFRGEFAAVINQHFPDRKIYLFDTFEGFCQVDLQDRSEDKDVGLFGRHLTNTSEQIVLDRLPHPEMAIIRKGYFPATAEGIQDRFCFVNLDMDLYRPTLEGLRFFYPKMISGGVILIHDYFDGPFAPGMQKAVKEFEEADGFFALKQPIGDGVSLAIIKH